MWVCLVYKGEWGHHVGVPCIQGGVGPPCGCALYTDVGEQFWE